MEANTVRLKEHDQAVLVLEKSPRASTLGSIKYGSRVFPVKCNPLGVCLVFLIKPFHLFCRYTVISGTPEKIIEHFLETMRMDIHPSEPGN